jgi:addiction module HigA family antidote
MKLKSSTIIDVDPRFRRLPLLHAGEVLREEFLLPLKLSPYALAKALGVPRTRVERLVREETALTADTALRLSRYFGTTAEFWMNLQAAHELETAKQSLASKLAKITPRPSRATARRGTGEFSPFARPARSEGPFGIRTH